MSDHDHQTRLGLAEQALAKSKQLHAALTLYLSEERTPRQIQAGLRKAADYLAASQLTAHVQGVGKEVRAVERELHSLQDYVDHAVANRLPITEDVSPTQSLPLVVAITARVTKLRSAQRAAELVAADRSAYADEHAELLRKNAQFAAKLPVLDKKGFGFARVPVVFTTDQGRNKHAGVGWLDADLASSLGFSVDLLDGYAVLNRQIVLGLDSRVAKIRDVDLDTEQVHHRDRMVKVRTLTYKGGQPTFVEKKRTATQRDFVDDYIQLLNSKTGVVHSLVSDKSYGYKGDSWFWIMPERDLRRLARAFPGGQVKLTHWGFAF